MNIEKDEKPKPIVGIVIIGRNEGERLKRAFQSFLNYKTKNFEYTALYVDSGSTDGSVELANSLNIPTHCLDPREPFSAARARFEGTSRIIDICPKIQYLQFLDGDCALGTTWLFEAVNYLILHPNVAIVCGKLTETTPKRSIFNKYNSIRWSEAPFGKIDSCGGIFLIRRSVYHKAGGFDPRLLTGEESELCSRIRNSGYKIVRLTSHMASHDSDLVYFSDWWNRAVWGGYGDALAYQVLYDKVNPQRRREAFSIFLWTFFLPIIGLLGIIGITWSKWFLTLTVLCMIGYLAILVKIMIYRLRRGDSFSDAFLYALLTLFRKFPNGIGVFHFWLTKASIKMRPDPHC